MRLRSEPPRLVRAEQDFEGMGGGHNTALLGVGEGAAPRGTPFPWPATFGGHPFCPDCPRP